MSKYQRDPTINILLALNTAGEAVVNHESLSPEMVLTLSLFSPPVPSYSESLNLAAGNFLEISLSIHTFLGG